MVICRYCSNLGPAKECGKKKGRVVGVGMGSTMFTFYTFNAIVFFCGCLFVYHGRFSGGDVLVVSEPTPSTD